MVFSTLPVPTTSLFLPQFQSSHFFVSRQRKLTIHLFRLVFQVFVFILPRVNHLPGRFSLRKRSRRNNIFSLFWNSWCYICRILYYTKRIKEGLFSIYTKHFNQKKCPYCPYNTHNTLDSILRTAFCTWKYRFSHCNPRILKWGFMPNRFSRFLTICLTRYEFWISKSRTYLL